MSTAAFQTTRMQGAAFFVARSTSSSNANPIPSAPVLRMGRRSLLLGTAFVAASPLPSMATGLESITLPTLETPSVVRELQERNQKVIDNAEASFQSSDLLKTLKERSEANKGQRKKELLDRYCKRQAEMGVGDCAGLRLIPGATKSGIQKKPEWLENLLGGGDE